MNLCEYEIESNSLPAVCTDLKLFPDHDKEILNSDDIADSSH